jgi:ribosomal protein S18 acetylase RimI-like enzyme
MLLRKTQRSCDVFLYKPGDILTPMRKWESQRKISRPTSKALFRRIACIVIGERIKNIPSNERFVVAKEGGRAVGLCRVERGDDVNELQVLYVLPEFQGYGVGGSLWREVEKFLDPEKDTIVKVADYNKKAIAFYEKLGFKDTGERLQDERFRMKSGAIISEIVMRRSKE